MDDASKLAKKKLTTASKSRDAARRLSVALATGAAGLSVLLVIALLDYWLVLPVAVRLGGTILLAILIVVGLFQLLSSVRHPAGLKDAALDVEAKKPELGCEISTAAEYLSGERQPSREYEQELSEALAHKAAQSLQRVEVPYWNRPLRPALVVCSLLFIGLLFGIIASGGFTAFQRAAVPWVQTSYTKVEVTPGNIEIAQGRDVDIHSIFSGRVPKDAQFQWLDEETPKWQFATLTRNDKGEYVYPLKNVRRPMHYRVSANDAVSPEYLVETYIPPEAKEFRLALAYPTYTKHPDSHQNTPDISVVRGSTASLRITPSAPLQSARLRFSNLPPLDLTQTPNGEWTGSFKINKDAEYFLELRDAKGHKGGNDAPWQIKALPDAAPKVEITEPGQDLRAEATNTIPIRISATDDFGVKDVRLVYNRLGASSKSVIAQRESETNHVYRAELPLSELDLKEYELVAFHADATDENSLDGPGLGKSETYFVEITSEEGGSCKSQGKGQRVNLLVIQKQIVSDTAALAANASVEKYDELAKRQQDALEFAEMYAGAIGAMGGDAVTEIAAAVGEMGKAKASLEKHSRSAALPSEEKALAYLYQVIKRMPELENLPTVPQMKTRPAEPQDPKLQVVLDAIKKKKKEQPDNKELSEALKEAEALRDEQASLMIGSQNSGNGSSPGETQLARAGNESKGREGEKGEGQKSNGKNGEGKKGEDKNDKSAAEKENSLSKQAADLAEKLARLAGKGSRLGHSASQKMSDAAAKMGAAAQAMAQGDMQTAGTKGGEGAASLDAAVALLDRMVNNKPELTDVSREDAPREYETQIAEYLKKLSHEE